MDMSITTAAASRARRSILVAGAMSVCSPVSALAVTSTLGTNSDAQSGVIADAAQRPWIATTNEFESSFSDRVHVYTTVGTAIRRYIYVQDATLRISALCAIFARPITTSAKTADPAPPGESMHRCREEEAMLSQSS
jgi:hypothetical protein